MLDLKNVEFNILTLPVSAICEIPEVILDLAETINFGEVYIRSESTKCIKLINTSSLLHAQFKILEQDEQSKSWGIFTCQTYSGKIYNFFYKLLYILKNINNIKLNLFRLQYNHSKNKIK